MVPEATSHSPQALSTCPCDAAVDFAIAVPGLRPYCEDGTSCNKVEVLPPPKGVDVERQLCKLLGAWHLSRSISRPQGMLQHFELLPFSLLHSTLLVLLWVQVQQHVITLALQICEARWCEQLSDLWLCVSSTPISHVRTCLASTIKSCTTCACAILSGRENGVACPVLNALACLQVALQLFSVRKQCKLLFR